MNYKLFQMLEIFPKTKAVHLEGLCNYVIMFGTPQIQNILKATLKSCSKY